jgi:hypothetical protein
MINENLLLFIIFLVLFVLFYISNILLKKNIEKYGDYCGQYNLASAGLAKSQCDQNKECKWNSYDTHNSSTPSGWCGQNPISTGDISPTSSTYDQVSALFHTLFNPTTVVNNITIPLSQTTGITF